MCFDKIVADKIVTEIYILEKPENKKNMKK